MNTPQDLWILLDLRGLTLQMYHSGTDPDSGSSNKQIKSPGHTLSNFMERYLLPISKLAPLNRIIAVGDAGNLYRKTLNPDYKIHRKPMEPDIKAAVDASQNAIRELLHSLGIAQVSVAYTEADDVLAYLNDKLPGHKLIYTVDADLTAMISPTTTVFLKGEPQTAYRKGELTILPKHVTLFKSLVGDTSDGIKGVSGFGPAAWATLLADFEEDGLDELINIIESANPGQIITIAEQAKHPLLDTLVVNLSAWRNSYLLAKLCPELVDGVQNGEFTRLRWEKRLPSRERLQRLVDDTSAYWLLQDLDHLLPTQTLITAKDWDDSVLSDAKHLFKNSRFISIDWESWSLEHKPL